MKLRQVIEKLEEIEREYGNYEELPVYVKRFGRINDIRFENEEDVEVEAEFEGMESEIITLPKRVRIY